MKIHFILFTLLGAGAATAAVRESASFTLLAEGTLPGRARLTSSHFSVDAACSPAGGTARSVHFTARLGYAGQLYDVTGRTLTANPSPVPETTAAQLSVSVTMDDGSTMAGPDTEPDAWQIVSGPVLSISSSGLATTGTVRADTPALLRATVAGVTVEGTVIVRDSIPDNYGPVASDGLADSWQYAHFDTDDDGDLDLPAGPAADADADGATNLDEWIAGTGPAHAGDLLRMEPMGLTAQGLRFRCGPILASRRYALLGRPGFTTPAQKILSFEPPADVPWHEFTVPDNGTPRSFFQLSVEIK